MFWLHLHWGVYLWMLGGCDVCLLVSSPVTETVATENESDAGPESCVAPDLGGCCSTRRRSTRPGWQRPSEALEQDANVTQPHRGIVKLLMTVHKRRTITTDQNRSGLRERMRLATLNPSWIAASCVSYTSEKQSHGCGEACVWHETIVTNQSYAN